MKSKNHHALSPKIVAIHAGFCLIVKPAAHMASAKCECDLGRVLLRPGLVASNKLFVGGIAVALQDAPIWA
jgi:hypothetical protein